MGFWDAYRASLKPREVEEPIDWFLHRPLAYVFAKMCFPTPISPDLVTVLSILSGAAAAVCIVVPFTAHMQVGALLVFMSIIFDCADGQLARMRGTSSPLGRMLDGVADLIVIALVVPATGYALYQKHAASPRDAAVWVGLAVVCVVTSSFHTAAYDHYKNVWLKFTAPTFKEGEDAATARARYEASKGSHGLVRELSYRIYVFYVQSQEDFARKFDPYTEPSLAHLPAYSDENAAIYRAAAGAPFAMLRRLFGFGSLMFGISLVLAIELPEAFVIFRLVVLNLIFYAYVRPRQRRGSAEALAKIEAAGGWSRTEAKQATAS